MTRPRLSIAQSIAVGLLGLSSFVAANGCDPSLAVPPANRQPTADARVLGMLGQNAVIDYTGMPVEVTLDGSFSKDPDGSIKKYRWLSGNALMGAGAAGSAAGGSSGSAAGSSAIAGTGAAASDDDAGAPTAIGNVQHRWVPAGAPKGWPEDIQQPKVMLSEGEYKFVLYVEDNKGLVSPPSTLKVTVRMKLDPLVEKCTTNVFPEVGASCKACVCGVNDMCRDTLTSKTVCDATCWGFLGCIATKCPDFRSGGPTDCLVANCSAFLGAASGAGMIAPCIAPCRDKCRSM